MRFAASSARSWRMGKPNRREGDTPETLAVEIVTLLTGGIRAD